MLKQKAEVEPEDIKQVLGNGLLKDYADVVLERISFYKYNQRIFETDEKISAVSSEEFKKELVSVLRNLKAEVHLILAMYEQTTKVITWADLLDCEKIQSAIFGIIKETMKDLRGQVEQAQNDFFDFHTEFYLGKLSDMPKFNDDVVLPDVKELIELKDYLGEKADEIERHKHQDVIKDDFMKSLAAAGGKVTSRLFGREAYRVLDHYGLIPDDVKTSLQIAKDNPDNAEKDPIGNYMRVRQKRKE